MTQPDNRYEFVESCGECSRPYWRERADRQPTLPTVGSERPPSQEERAERVREICAAFEAGPGRRHKGHEVPAMFIHGYEAARARVHQRAGEGGVTPPHFHGRSICTGEHCTGHDGLVDMGPLASAQRAGEPPPPEPMSDERREAYHQRIRDASVRHGIDPTLHIGAQRAGEGEWVDGKCPKHGYLVDGTCPGCETEGAGEPPTPELVEEISTVVTWKDGPVDRINYDASESMRRIENGPSAPAEWHLERRMVTPWAALDAARQPNRKDRDE